MGRHTLRAHHVVVAEAFEPLVHEAVRNIPSRSNVLMRRKEVLAYLGEGEVVVVERTFLDMPRAMRSPQSVIQSTAVCGVVRERVVAVPGSARQSSCGQP